MSELAERRSMSRPAPRDPAPCAVSRATVFARPGPPTGPARVAR